MVREGHNLLILGQSGTGKSFLTQKIASALRKAGKHVNLTATTGIAALGINGKTIHSWCGVGDGSISQDKLLQKLENNKNYLKQRNNILQTHCLIIDEISMLRDLPEDTHNLIRRMNRPLPPGPDPIRLCARKFECDVYNASKLLDMDGEGKSYSAKDSGEKKFLQSIPVPEILYLKVNSPVTLLKNLSEKLVNGLQGKITKLCKDSVFVYFDRIASEVELRAETFSVYSTLKEKVIASRIQLPVSLAFSITIHKAQGLTLERIEVDASNIFSPGQLGVAVGRTTAKKHLRIKNFHPSAVIKQQDCIVDFYRNSDCLLEEEYEDSQTCCKSNIFVNMDQNAEIDFGENYQYPDSELSDFDENDIQNIDDILLEQEESGEGFKVFEEKLRAKITEIFSMVHGNSGNSTTSKSWTKYYSEIYKFSISNDYEKLVEEVFKRKPSSTEYEICRKSFDAVTSSVLKEKSALVESNCANRKLDTLPEPEAGSGKVRYIGGACVAKSRHHFMRCTRSGLYKKDKTKSTSFAYLKVKMLDHLTWTEQSLLESKFQKSLEETKKRQYISAGLTNINDETYLFFINLNDKRKKVQNEKSFALYGSNCMSFSQDTLSGDKELQEKWTDLFRNFDYSDQRTVHVNTEIMEVCSQELFYHIIGLFCRIGNSQFRRDMLLKIGKEKSERLRKKVISTESLKNNLQQKRLSSEVDDSNKHDKKQKKKVKARVTKSRRNKKSEETETTNCPSCNRQYSEGERWVACDTCDRWFDTVCLGISDIEWKKLTDSVDSTWFCQDCKVKLFKDLFLKY
ncbi:hypothetical protein FSP39_009090 [Pinctada imbricata]|uniref:ATP-dependent DNA helicase n=1 Tax=Pinctada imbricata TaxID=66713 RepID=A0AA89BJ89_PINIB|nr:hypothetical protein FSP39_009090 [Pinctada imbricata]